MQKTTESIATERWWWSYWFGGGKGPPSPISLSMLEPFHVELQVVNRTINVKGAGRVIVKIFPRWAPLGALRLKEIVESGAWDEARFFRSDDLPNSTVCRATGGI